MSSETISKIAKGIAVVGIIAGIVLGGILGNTAYNFTILIAVAVPSLVIAFLLDTLSAILSNLEDICTNSAKLLHNAGQSNEQILKELKEIKKTTKDSTATITSNN